MKQINFSVLLSVYSKENPLFLKLALESIWINQNVKPNEIVIVKDGPLNKELENVLFDFSQIAPVKYVVNIENKGLSTSLNLGLLQCTNEFVARMDTDDICFENRFERQIKYMTENLQCDIVGSYAMKIDENGQKIGLMKVPLTNKNIYELIWTCPFIHPTVFFKKDSIIRIGSYNTNSGVRQDDYELWFRSAINGLNFGNIPEPLLYYRFFKDNIIKNNFKVGLDRYKVGFKGCRSLNCSFIAYIGITFPLIRSLLPYPFNLYFYKFMDKINPRKK